MSSTLLETSRLLLLRPNSSRTVCSQCRRAFATTAVYQAGHNKWSKVKHIKGKKDAIKGKERTLLSDAITLYSKMYGADPNINSSLANAIAAARKISMPKATIDQAVARGQGRSLSGATLEPMKFEVMMPPLAAFILDVETDNRARALQDINVVIHRHKGRNTTTEFFFSRRGRVVFEKHETHGVDEVMDEAIDLDAEELDADEEGNIVVWCSPTRTMAIAKGLSVKFGLKILTADILWDPNQETCSKMDSVEDVKRLEEFVTALSEMPEVRAIYSNAVKGEGVPDEAWEAFVENLDS